MLSSNENSSSDKSGNCGSRKNSGEISGCGGGCTGSTLYIPL
jgi:hypothetical protein